MYLDAGARRKQRQDDLGLVDSFLDLRGPGVAAAASASIQPYLESAFRQVAMETSCEFRAILARVRKEYAGDVPASHSQASI